MRLTFIILCFTISANYVTHVTFLSLGINSITSQKNLETLSGEKAKSGRETMGRQAISLLPSKKGTGTHGCPGPFQTLSGPL